MENGSNCNKIETEKQRRLQHKIACSKLLSLVVSLLSFPKPSFILTFEQTLKFVMVCIIRYVMYHKIFGVDNDGQDGQRGCIKTTLIAWSEDDIDIIDYGEEFPYQPIQPVGSKLSDVINLESSGNLKKSLINVFKGLNPWEFNHFGPVECLIKPAQQKKKKWANHEDVPPIRIMLTGVLIRGNLLDFQQVGKENPSSERACKRALQPLNNNGLIAAKRCKTGPLQSMQTKPRFYTAWLSLITGRFTHFCENFVAVTGIHDALNRYPTEFLHPDDVFWSQTAFYLWTMGKCNEPCTYRLKRQNPDGYIHIECVIQLTRQHENTEVINILSTVKETGGESLIQDTQKRLQNQLLELLKSCINKQAPPHRSGGHQLMPVSSNHLSNQIECYDNTSTYSRNDMTIGRSYNEALHQKEIRLLTDINTSQTPEPVFYSTALYNNSQENWIADAVSQLPVQQQQQQYPDASWHSSPENYLGMRSDPNLVVAPGAALINSANDDLFSSLSPETFYTSPPITSTPFDNNNPYSVYFEQNEANETSRHCTYKL
ncbi:uncharacterized protein LOC124314074 isoform X2 [Daphnia pulicaria]|uniref:uncharacterized protein LOC124314074 isoform X2 n=1 Tax=Daphnia pulicaria TaxID=35523 RepID=UPI001EEBFAC9|nr:uncharacterized protein LOC124314074 isoform X2 [Daphnia pulicaria]